MSLSHIELLNQILTNTLIYKGKLDTLSERPYSEETYLKLRDFADRRNQQANELIQIINELGGHVQSTPNRTDAPKISWCDEVLPNSDDIIALLNYLIKAERDSLKDYRQAQDQISNNEINSKLKEHILQGEATLKYLQAALETNQVSNQNQ
jgi:hypothetical protein